MSTLEYRYCRLLRMYPRAHRRVHGEEMLAVLLACAAPGQQRLSMADRFDLVSGALRIRWRHLQSAFGPQWSDALAVASFIAPLLMLACSPNPMVSVLVDGDFDPRPLKGMPFDPTMILEISYIVGWTAVTLTGLLGKRWASAATASALAAMALYLRLTVNGLYSGADLLDPPLLLTGLIAAIAFIASPGPRRGVQLIGARGALFSVVVAALVFVLNTDRLWTPYFDLLPYLGVLSYLLLIPVLAGPSLLRLRVAALLVPHVAGAATYWVGIASGLFTVELDWGTEALLGDEAYYSAYAAALLSLLLLLLRVRAVRVPTRSPSNGQVCSLSTQS